MYKTNAHPHAFGCYLQEVSRHSLLSADEESRLCQAVRAGDRHAWQRMIECNLRLVIRIARQYQNSQMALEDLVEEGNLGLMHALDKFDPDRGFRFSTYAIWWIRQYIERALMNQSRTVRLPVHMAKRLNACLRASRELSHKRYREASAEEIARHTGRPVHEVRELLPWHERPASLDVCGEDELDWHEALAAPEHGEPAHEVAASDTHAAITRWIKRLKPREQDILSLRFGLQGQPELTFERIAAHVGVTRERARQICLEALAKLRIWMQEENFDPDFRDES